MLEASGTGFAMGFRLQTPAGDEWIFGMRYSNDKVIINNYV